MLKLLQSLLSALLLVVPDKAGSFESRWTSGLGVTTGTLTGETAVNGVGFRIERATGRDVGLLADRILDDWQLESGVEHVIPSTAGEWRLLSRIHRGASEVVQWRGAGGEGELLWSSMNLLRLGRPPESTVPLPPDCKWSPRVHGSVDSGLFIQNTGSCPGDPANVAARFRRLLSGSGWTLREPAGLVLRAQRGGHRAQIMLVSTTRHASPATDVVVLELRAAAP